jgi:phage gp29-like protein
MIFIGLSADLLLMGNTTTGSFALGAIKQSLTGATVEGYLKNIVQTFNLDLIKHLYELNNWDVSRMCELDFEGFEDVDLDSFSKSIQRIGSVGYLPRTLDVINDILRKHGLDALPEGTDLDEVLPEKTSKAGEGMSTVGEGTAKEVSGKDSASLNTENA